MSTFITTLATVRQGTLQLTVDGIIGGNAFDVLFMVLADADFTQGLIYYAASTPEPYS